MSIFGEGRIWQVRALADAAREEAQAARDEFRDRDEAYAEGVEDVLRFLVEDAQVPPGPLFIYNRYLEATS